MPDPGQSDLPMLQLWEHGPTLLAGASRQQSLPYHFPEKGSRIKMFRGGEVFKRSGQGLANNRGPVRLLLRHKLLFEFSRSATRSNSQPATIQPTPPQIRGDRRWEQW